MAKMRKDDPSTTLIDIGWHALELAGLVNRLHQRAFVLGGYDLPPDAGPELVKIAKQLERYTKLLDDPNDFLGDLLDDMVERDEALRNAEPQGEA